MKPLIIISSQSLACGCLIAEAVMKAHSEKEAPHLIIGESRPSPEKILMELKLKWHEPINLGPLLRRESGRERANQNQPWYAKFQKRRRHN